MTPPLILASKSTTRQRLLANAGINFDFIYGLPKQTANSISDTIQKIVKLNPDRIHCLNLEHRPDVYRHQKAYKEEDLPKMYEISLGIFQFDVNQ